MSTSVKIPVSVLLAAVAAAAAALAVLVTVLVTGESSAKQGAPSLTTLVASSAETTAVPAVETTVVVTTTTSEPALVVDEASRTETKPLPVFHPALVDSAYGCINDLLVLVDSYFAWSNTPDTSFRPGILDGWCAILEADATELGDLGVRSALNRVKASEPWQAFGVAGLAFDEGESVDRAFLLRQARAFEDAVFDFADELADLGLELP